MFTNQESAFARVFQAASPEKKERLLRSVNERVADILQKEGVSAPSVEFHVALICHADASDALALKEELEKSDVFIPELAGTDEKTISILNRLSQGEIKPREAYRQMLVQASGSTVFGSILSVFGVPLTNFQEFETALHKILYKSEKKVAHVDVGKDSDLPFFISMAFRDVANSLKKLLVKKNLSFEDARENVARSMIKVGLAQKLREEHMLNTLPQAIAKTILKNEDLQHPNRTEPIRVFMFLGADHETVPRKIEQVGDSITYEKVQKTKKSRESITQKVCAGETITEEDKNYFVLTTIFSALYQSAPKKIKARHKDFVHKFSKGALVSVLADVYIDNAEEIYNTFKGGAPKNLSEFKYNEFIIRFFIQLLNEREDEIELALNTFENENG